MIGLAQNMLWWHWWILAAVLAALETFMPGAVAIWFAASAFVIGALLLVVPIPWQLQIVLFGVLGLVALFVWRRYKRADSEHSDQPLLNQRAAQHIGQVLTLVEPVVNGFGKAGVGDSVWRVSGPELPVGARVRVSAVEGSTLVVQPE
jgi:membrane protein implicated in regulation of membrane protease activity